MKPILSKLLGIVTLLAFALTPALTRAQDAPPPPPDAQGDQGDQGASFQTFYDQLGDQGQWIQTDDYGYVFQPSVTDPNWAPYTDGHWVYTDAGWAWVSDEPWGWATYHYGRWANIDGTGWVWVPGYHWAPAWVSWRYGGGYCGWAPLPPETFVGVEYGRPGFDSWSTFHFGGDVDVSFGIGAGCYNFVRVGDMGYRNYRGHYEDRNRNYTIINNTTNITNINVNKTVINNYGAGGNNFRGVAVGGPPINEINAHASQRIQTVQLAGANQPGRSTLQGNTLAVYAPHVNAASQREARPTRVAQTLDHPALNRGVSINKPLQATASVQPVAPSEAAIREAQAAQLHPSEKAKIATERTVPKTTLDKPLTSMSTLTPTRSAGPSGVPAANTINPNVERTPVNSPYTGQPGNPKPNTERAAVNAPINGEVVNPKPKVDHTPVNSPYTGETSNSQAEVAQQRRLQQERAIQQQNSQAQQERIQQQHDAAQQEARQRQQEIIQQQHAQALQSERQSAPVERAPVQHQQQQQQQAPVQQQAVRPPPQPAPHPQPAPQERSAPQQQAPAKKQNDNGSGGPGGPPGR